VGTAILSKKNGGLNNASVKNLVAQLAALHKNGHDVVLVSSGAIAAGVGRLHLSGKPKDLGLKQAAAAVGQLALMEAYESAFKRFRITPAQVLLTRDDLTHRERYQNARKTLNVLLNLRTVPIINENDTVATEEIKFGDNDSLSAFVAVTLKAHKLILLSDVDGLFELGKNGELTDRQIYHVRDVARVEKQVSKTKGSKLSTGGMAAKLMAAKRATSAGVETWIGSGRKPNILAKILAGAPNVATRFQAR
jgi:glutamate 5-kinase